MRFCIVGAQRYRSCRSHRVHRSRRELKGSRPHSTISVKRISMRPPDQSGRILHALVSRSGRCDQRTIRHDGSPRENRRVNRNLDPKSAIRRSSCIGPNGRCRKVSPEFATIRPRPPQENQKSIQSQFGQKCDIKKAGNTQARLASLRSVHATGGCQSTNILFVVPNGVLGAVDRWNDPAVPTGRGSQ